MANVLAAHSETKHISPVALHLHWVNKLGEDYQDDFDPKNYEEFGFKLIY